MATIVAPLDLRAVAEPTAVGRLRRQVRRWLSDFADDPDAADDLVLALSEALENVVDHAFLDAPHPGTITVHARRDHDTTTVVITDNGHWHHTPIPPRPEEPDSPLRRISHRGRGLSMITQLAHASDIATGPAGTTVTLTQRC